MQKLAWYTAVRNGKLITAISGPHATKRKADAQVAKPGSRDREIAEALDPWACFYDFLTVAFRAGKRVRTVLGDPRATRRLREKGIEVPAC